MAHGKKGRAAEPSAKIVACEFNDLLANYVVLSDPGEPYLAE